jgi:hypothetical protein
MRDQLTLARATQMTGMCDRDLAPILADLPSVWAERSEGILRIMGCSTVAPLSPPRCAFDAPGAHMPPLIGPQVFDQLLL